MNTELPLVTLESKGLKPVSVNVDEYNFGYPFVFGKKKYARILIRKKNTF